jgi:predicted N-formylglutamate amidohydrolase
LVVSAEHASSAIPEALRSCFVAADDVLDSHLAWDPGAGMLAKRLASAFDVEAHCGEVSRLVVDCNRSIGHPKLFSRWLQPLDEAARRAILRNYYSPFREAVRIDLERALRQFPSVLHVSVHSFTETFEGRRREADVGFLYDPSRRREKEFCAAWRRLLATHGGYRIRRNYPYRGVSDGHVTALRRCYPDTRYLGLELEINQRILDQPPAAWAGLEDALVASVAELVHSGPASLTHLRDGPA